MGRAWRASRFPLLLAGVATVLILVATWPVARNPGNSFYGFGNDNLGGIWIYWWWSYARQHGLDPDFSPRLGYPHGFDLSSLPVQPWERISAEVLTRFTDPVTAYNIIILSSFPLAAVTMYLLANHLLHNRWAAAFAGLVYAFAPFHFGMAMNYPGLGSVQFVPLYFLAVAAFVRSGRAGHFAAAVMLLGLVAVGSYYYAYYAFWVTLVIAAVYAWRRRRTVAAAWKQHRQAPRRGRGRALAAGAAAMVVTVAFLAWQPLQLYLNNRATLERPLSEAVHFSLRPYLWLTPPIDHPYFGTGALGTYWEGLYGAPYNEQAMYLGYVPLALAIVGVGAALLAGNRRMAAADGLRFAVGFGLVVGITGAVIALGPRLPLSAHYSDNWTEPPGTHYLPLPGRLLFELMPTFRFFSRAQVFVVLALALVAAAGLVVLWRRIGRVGAIALGVMAVVGVGFEYANRPPARVVDMGPTPPAYRWLAAQPSDTAAVEYPFAGPATPRGLYYQYWQRVHEANLVNIPGTPEANAFAATISDITDRDASPRLAAAGVDYVIVHTALPPATYPPYQPGWSDDSLPRDLLDGYPQLELARRFPDADVYRVLARPRATRIAATVPAAGVGFYPPEPSAKGPLRWMADRGEMRAEAVARPGTKVVFTATASSFGEPRTLTVRVNGRAIGRTRVMVDAGSVRMPFTLPAGELIIELHASNPPARTPAEVTGVPDPRPLSVQLLNPRIELP